MLHGKNCFGTQSAECSEEWRALIIAAVGPVPIPSPANCVRRCRGRGAPDAPRVFISAFVPLRAALRLRFRRPPRGQGAARTTTRFRGA